MLCLNSSLLKKSVAPLDDDLSVYWRRRTAALKDVISIMSVAQLHYCKTLANLWKVTRVSLCLKCLRNIADILVVAACLLLVTQGTVQAIPINLDAAVERAKVVLPDIAEGLPAQRPSTPVPLSSSPVTLASSPPKSPVVETQLAEEDLEEARESAEQSMPRLTEMLEPEPYDEEEYDV